MKKVLNQIRALYGKPHERIHEVLSTSPSDKVFMRIGPDLRRLSQDNPYGDNYRPRRPSPESLASIVGFMLPYVIETGKRLAGAPPEPVPLYEPLLYAGVAALVTNQIRNSDSVLRQVARGTREGLSYLGDYVRDLKETRKVR